MNMFASRISDALKQSEFTQKQIAKMLGISEGNITNWKKGENLPSVDILYKLCIILNESADYLLGLEDETGEHGHDQILNSLDTYYKMWYNYPTIGGDQYGTDYSDQRLKGYDGNFRALQADQRAYFCNEKRLWGYGCNEY